MKDLVSTELSSACFYRVENVSLCFTVLSGVSSMLQALVQLTDREVLAHRTFNQILLDRKDINKEIQVPRVPRGLARVPLKLLATSGADVLLKV